MFDTVKMIDTYMSIDMWLECYRALTRVLEKLSEEPNLKLGPILIDDLATQAMANQGMNKGKETAKLTSAAAKLVGDGESKGEEKQQMMEEEEDDMTDFTKDENDPNMLRVPGDLGTYIERLSNDFTKSLQQTDPNTGEYVERLNNEGLFLTLAEKVQTYYMRHHMSETTNGSVEKVTVHSKNACKMAVKRILHMYYKHDTIAAKLEQHAANVAKFGKTEYNHPSCKSTVGLTDQMNSTSTTHPGSWLGGPSVENVQLSNIKKTMSSLCRYVFSNSADASKDELALAQLCHVYYHALHDRFHDARDLMLMSKLEPVSHDISIQIMYNRTVTQLGLCAFRIGLYNEAKDCLSEICGRNKQKELLAQGMSYFRGRGQERDVEAERAEKRRQVP